MFRPIKFTLLSSLGVGKKLFFIYFVIQTILALTFIIDLFSYKVIIDTISGKLFFGLSLYGVLIALLIYYLSYKVLEGISNYVWNLLDARLSVYLNGEFIDKLSSLDLSIFENAKNVGLANRAFNRFQFQFKFYLKAIFDVYGGIIKLFISLLIFFYVSPILAIAIILANAIHIYINSKHAYGVFLIYRADDEIKRKFEYIVSTIFSKDTLPEIKLYQAFGFLKEKILKIIRQFTNHQLKVERKHIFYDTFSGFLPTISIFAYSLYIAGQVTNGIISAGQFIFLFFNALTFNGTLFTLGQNMGHLHADGMFIEDAIEFFDLKANIAFPKLKSDELNLLKKKLERPTIKIENVSFQYPNNKNWVLKDINLEIPYGQNLAIIGENGAGKTTLVRLILRMYDPLKGSIRINDIDIRAIPEDVLFRVYSTLFQSFGKFYFTIRENMEMASNRKLDDEEVKEFLNFSNSWEFVKAMKKGVDQQLGSEFTEGIDLSGGQWQRLSIARAYAKRAPILILDEPTSSVDAKSEMEIFDRLIREMRDNTLVFISHRFSTIKDAERIVVVDKGRIIEDGSHEALMKKKGKYAKLYSIQAERYKRR